MSEKQQTQPFYKRKWFAYTVAILLVLSAFSLFGGNDEEEQAEQSEETPKQAIAEDKAEVQAEPAVEEAHIKPLTKEEVLAKFPLVSDEEPYIDGQFTFVGNRTDTADYYAFADTDRYRNASVIFKDGEIARVKFIPEGDADPVEILAEFGITDKPREISGLTGYYEVALIPMYWSQNIERYPFELD